MRTLREINVKDYELSKVQTQAKDTFVNITKKQIIDGVLLTDLMLTAGTPLRVNHKLNRKYQGWIIANKNTNANIWESISTMPDREIILNTSANTKISLWVF